MSGSPTSTHRLLKSAPESCICMVQCDVCANKKIRLKNKHIKANNVQHSCETKFTLLPSLTCHIRSMVIMTVVTAGGVLDEQHKKREWLDHAALVNASRSRTRLSV
eukprot:1425824-Amphidinium_carterae.2